MLHLRSNCSVFGGPGDVAGVAGCKLTMYGTLFCACCAATAVVAAVESCGCNSVAVAAPPMCGGFNKHDGLSGGVISE